VQEWNKNNPPTQRELTLEEEYNKIRKNYGEYIERYHADKK
jgi:endonuclease I